MIQKRRISLFITDMDNTLFDWFGMWHASFSILITEVAKTSGINEEILLNEARTVHQRHGTAEYSLLLEELPSLQALHPKDQIKDIYNDAIHAYRRARKETLHLYPGVSETLAEIKAKGTPIVAYTESMGFYSITR